MQSTLMLGLALAVGAPAPKEAPKKDPPSLLGEWVPSSAVVAGKPDPPPPGTTLTFTTDGKCIAKEGKDEPSTMTYTLDPKKDPPEIDLNERQPGMGAMAMKGIYKIDGDTLLLCISMDGERPKAFASPAGSSWMFITLKRAKKD